ncbi:phosphonate transport system ATP-binding protein [Salibacterium salarium]|uniref:phosphonate ABC transporter ATP-binding protein n=1 Tax=Salibacterium salarium TaxID=284579 RepID=UPI002785E5FF|nr:phosphonate ABC transporter ATP-binding protein [Salibacterium salarium]MDQ0300558.1 phosphonate transport system ATP-binding protein [Salibacterium salarium]
MPETILDIKSLRKIYKDGTPALNGISLTINKGEIVAVIGPSGAGKSTFLRSLNRLVEPTSGEIWFRGQNMLKLKKKELRWARREIGMIFQHFHLIKRVSVVQNVLHGKLGYMSAIKGGLGWYSQSDTKEAIAILERVGLEQELMKRADELSGGQQQRVGLARALAQRPSLLLADEPIASLDPSSSERVMEYLSTFSREEGMTTIVNLHQFDMAAAYADRIIAINNGEVVFDGAPDKLQKQEVKQIYV